MTGRRTNLALLVLLAAAFVTGISMWAIGSGWSRWPTIAHGTVGVAMLALAPWKSVIVRRGVHRRSLWRVLPAVTLVALVGIALGTGVAHRAGMRRLGPLLVLQLHVGAALAAVPLAAWHVRARPVRPRPADLERRAVLRAAALVGGSVVVTTALPHAGRPETRSLERGSFDPSAMPVTQWLFDDVPDVEVEHWRLHVGDRRWSLDELARLPSTEVVATLDCTGGWYARQRWRGVRLDQLLAASAASGGRSIVVRSATGYHRRFPRADSPVLLLATEVGGEPLTPGHGFPARLVAPNRRGFWWVKWVSEISVDDRPWWWQSPFSLR